MTYKTYIIDDFEDHGLGEIVANQSGSTWAAEATDDDLASVVAGSVLLETKCLRIYDTSNTIVADFTKTLPFTLSTLDVFRFGATKPVTAAASSSWVDFKFREAASIIVYLRLRLDNGTVYYSEDAGSTFTTTGVTLTLDAINLNLDIEFTSSTTFKIRLHNAAWSAALNNDNTFSAGITKLEIGSSTANGTAESGIDTFDTYGAGAEIRDEASPIGTWNAWTQGYGHLTQDSNRGKLLSDASGATPYYSLTFSTPGTSFPCSLTFKCQQSQQDKRITIFFADAATPSKFFAFTLLSDYLWVYNYSGWEQNLHLVGLTEITYTITFHSSTSFTVNAYGHDFGPYANYDAGGEVSSLGAIAIQLANQNSGTFYIDDIKPSWLYVAATTVNVDLYIDELWGMEASHGAALQEYSITKVANDVVTDAATTIPCTAALQLSATSILVPLAQKGLYLVTGANHDTWTLKISMDTFAIMAQPAAGTIISTLSYNVGEMPFKKSTDSGVNWVDWGGVPGYHVQDLFVSGGTTHAWCVKADGSEVRVFRDPGSDNNWDGLDAEAGTFTVYIEGFERGFVANGYYYCVENDAGVANLFKYNIAGNAITQVFAISGTYKVRTTFAAGLLRPSLPALIYDSNSSWSDQVSGVAFCVLWTADESARAIFQTSTGGGSWASISTTAALFEGAVPHGYVRSGYYQWGYDPVLDIACRYDTTLHHFIAGYKSTDVGNPVMITDACVIFDNTDSAKIDVYAPRLAAPLYITKCDIYRNIVASVATANHADFETAAANAGVYAIGDYVEFYDAWDNAWFCGNVVMKSVRNGVCKLSAIDSTRELSRIYDDTFAAKKISEMLTTTIQTFSRGGVGSIQDVNYAGTLTYNLGAHYAITPLVRLARVLERSVIWVTPANTWNLDHHDDCDATGFRWKYKSGLQISLSENAVETCTIMPTRDSVNYTNAGVLTRLEIIQNAQREAIEGIVAIPEFKDSEIVNATDADDICDQLYAIFNTETIFMHFIAANCGFIQEGKTVDVSWTLGDTVVARTTMIVIAVHAYAMQDVSEVVVSNNILLESEFDNIALSDDNAVK